MYHILKITSKIHISPTCIKNVIYQASYQLQLVKHELNLTNYLTFEGNISEVNRQRNNLDLRPLYNYYFDSIPAGAVPEKLIFNDIPYYNYFISKVERPSINFVEIGLDLGQTTPLRLSLSTIPSLTSELPVYLLNIGLLTEVEITQYLHTLEPEFREIILNDDFNNPVFHDNISYLIMDLREFLGNNWVNSRNYGIL